MDQAIWAGPAAGLLISVVTAPVGVSGAVFLLPVQLSLLGVPSPAVTPTNLLFNVVAGPGALWRYRRDAALHDGLARRLVLWTLPGVIAGAAIRVFALPGPGAFRLLVAALLLSLGTWLCLRTSRPVRQRPEAAEPPAPALALLALMVGTAGGIYGIGGGSLLGPVAPNWWLGLGGLIGGCLGARLQPRLPETLLRVSCSEPSPPPSARSVPPRPWPEGVRQ